MSPYDIQILVQAQNRTTHAVRAISRFLVITVCGSIVSWVIGGVIFYASAEYYSGQATAIGLGLILEGLSLLIAVIAADIELARSKVRQ